MRRKFCGGCKRRLPVTRFSFDRSRGDGRNTQCRECCGNRWKRNNSSPCVDCGGPRRSVTPGQCIRCYRFAIWLRDREIADSLVVSSYIYEAQRPLREFMAQLGKDKQLSPTQKLQQLVDKVADGNTKVIRTKSKSA